VRESREQSKERLEPGEERSLTELPKGVPLPWSFDTQKGMGQPGRAILTEGAPGE
jgi:hypothetical protein